MPKHDIDYPREEGSGARNRNERICLILNPHAGAGRAGREVEILERAVDRAFAQWEIRKTERQGHATELARGAVEDGFDIVAAVGGDGTCSEVVAGLFDGERARSRKAVFTVVPFGTGSDLIKSLQIPRALNESLWVAATGITLPTDVGSVTLNTAAGPQSRLFINVAGFGINGEVVLRANRSSKRFGGAITFFQATAESLFSYRPRRVTVEWDGPDGKGAWEGDLTSGFVANGAYCGGGMWVGKGGSMVDGCFDLTLLPSATLARQLLSAPLMYNGNLDRIDGAVRARATWVKVNSTPAGGVNIDLDGEMPGQLPAEFKVLPRSLNVRGGWTQNPLLNG